MNAVNAMLREQQEADLDTAVAAANKWVDLARPIIVTMFKIEDMASEIVAGSSFDPRDHAYRTLRDAKDEVWNAFGALNKMLDGIRDDFIADQRKTCGRTDEETEAFDAFNDALEGEVISEAEAVKMVAREWNDAFQRAA